MEDYGSNQQYQDEAADDPLPMMMLLPTTDDTSINEPNEAADRTAETTVHTTSYNSSKPSWWKRLSNGRATKAQKRAMQAMDAYRFQRPSNLSFGTPLSSNWNEIFGNQTAVEPRSLESSTVDKSSDDGDSLGPNNDNANNHRRVVWIEIGCGKGENILALAHRNRHDENFCLIGAEIHPVAVGNIFSRLHQAKQKQAFWKGYTIYGEKTFEMVQEEQQQNQCIDPGKAHDCNDNNTAVLGETISTGSSKIFDQDVWDKDEIDSDPYRNVRVFRGDGMKLLATNAADHSVDRIMVTFPDPFPEKRQESYRLFQLDTVREFHRVLVQDQGILCLATDHAGCFAWALQTVMNHCCSSTKACWEQVRDIDRMEWLPAVSSYESKGWKEGRPTLLACWRAVS